MNEVIYKGLMYWIKIPNLIVFNSSIGIGIGGGNKNSHQSLFSCSSRFRCGNYYRILGLQIHLHVVVSIHNKIIFW